VSESVDPPTTADRSLLRAFRAWGGDAVDRSWARFSPGWRERLGEAWPAASRATPEAAWDELRRDHAASSRPDPARVHPSWFVRALKTESPAVRRAVAAHAPGPIGEALRRGLGLSAADLAPDRPADPEALRWTLAFWTERLVGDVASRPDDPPVVVALARLAPRDLARLVKVTGLAKLAFLPAAEGGEGWMSTVDRVRLGYLRRHVGRADPRLVAAARSDLGALGPDPKRRRARLGLVTFGRLLAMAEPHRARWAVQHVPYPVARQMRALDTPPLGRRALASWEAWVLEAAWARLLREGWLSGGPPS